jgi:3-oxoacyl-[acyl-carrier-protein] synthase II
VGPDAFWRSLVEGRGGVKPIRAFDTGGLPIRIAAEIPDFDAKTYVLDKQARRALRIMARTIQMAVSAAQLAMDETKVDRSKLDPTRFGVEFGASMIATELPDLVEAARVSSNCVPGVVDLAKWGTQGLEAIQPLWMLKYLPNMPASHVSMLHDARGPNNSITENDVASLLALGESYRILKRDQADFFLVGGAESRINPLTLTRLCLFESMSRRTDAEKAARPFDRGRDGIVLGEGAAVLVLEELEHARKRGARIYAEVVGFGSAFDLKKNGSGLARAVRAALADAGIGPDEVDHVNAHGLGTRESDVREARALGEVFGACKEPVPVFAAKSYFGNLGAGGGTTELAASVLALQHGAVPATLNYEEPDPECPVAVVAGTPRAVRRPHVVKVSFTQPGQCAAVVVRKV